MMVCGRAVCGCGSGGELLAFMEGMCGFVYECVCVGVYVCVCVYVRV